MKKSILTGLVLSIAFLAGAFASPVRTEPGQAQQAEPISIPSTPENSICQDPYYQTNTDPNGPTICELKPGYTDCHNFTAVPGGQECTSGPQPYQEPVVEPEPVKPINTCQEG